MTKLEREMQLAGFERVASFYTRDQALEYQNVEYQNATANTKVRKGKFGGWDVWAESEQLASDTARSTFYSQRTVKGEER